MRQDLIEKFCNVVDFVFDYEPRTLFTAVFRHIFQTVCTRHRQCQMWSLHYHTHTHTHSTHWKSTHKYFWLGPGNTGGWKATQPSWTTCLHHYDKFLGVYYSHLYCAPYWRAWRMANLQPLLRYLYYWETEGTSQKNHQYPSVHRQTETFSAKMKSSGRRPQQLQLLAACSALVATDL